jgi:hypothetical protein
MSCGAECHYVDVTDQIYSKYNGGVNEQKSLKNSRVFIYNDT